MQGSEESNQDNGRELHPRPRETPVQKGSVEFVDRSATTLGFIPARVPSLSDFAESRVFPHASEPHFHV